MQPKSCVHPLCGIVLFLLISIPKAFPQETFTDDFLVVADASEHGSNLYQIEVETGKTVPLLLTRPLRPVALAFDVEDRAVYWTDVANKCIRKFIIDGNRGNSITVFQDTSGGSIMDGLALDVVHEKLYYSDAGVSPKVVEMNLDGTEPVTIVQDGTMKPRALVLDEENRELYCTDWGDLPGIYKVNISAKQRIRILGDGLVWPNALAIDFQEQMMYWADANIDRIEMANLDGSGRVTIITEFNVHYFAIALSPEYLYITDWSHGAVRKLDRRTHQISEQKPKIFKRLMGIIYYNSSLHEDINQSSPPTKYAMPEDVEAATTTEPSAIPSGMTDMVKPGDGTTLHPLSKNHAGALQIDHTMVIIIAVIVGGLVLMTGVITLGVYCANASTRTRATVINDHYQRPDHSMASYSCYSTPIGASSSNTYEYIPYAKTFSEEGYLNSVAGLPTEDYLKPVDDYSKPEGVYLSIKDDDVKLNFISLGSK